MSYGRLKFINFFQLVRIEGLNMVISDRAHRVLHQKVIIETYDRHFFHHVHTRNEWRKSAARSKSDAKVMDLHWAHALRNPLVIRFRRDWSVCGSLGQFGSEPCYFLISRPKVNVNPIVIGQDRKSSEFSDILFSNFFHFFRKVRRKKNSIRKKNPKVGPEKKSSRFWISFVLHTPDYVFDCGKIQNLHTENAKLLFRYADG